jgi:uncharacterized protein (DUF3084 family)
MTFSEAEQKKHRAAFIEECRQKAWGAACHAELISKQLDELMAQYKKLNDEDQTLEAEIKALEVAPDYHTVENRLKRKTVQERRNVLAKSKEIMGANMQRGQQAMQQLHQAIESGLELAKHAEGWGWKEAQT